MVLNQLFDSDAHCPCSALKAMLPLERGGRGDGCRGRRACAFAREKCYTFAQAEVLAHSNKQHPRHTAHLNTNAHSIVKRMTTKKRSCSKACTSAATNMRTLTMAWGM